jgi:hypothetical protein
MAIFLSIPVKANPFNLPVILSILINRKRGVQ